MANYGDFPGLNRDLDNRTKCGETLRSFCGNPSSPMWSRVLFYNMQDNIGGRSVPKLETDIAIFHLLRMETAFFGYGWTGCNGISPTDHTRRNMQFHNLTEGWGRCALHGHTGGGLNRSGEWKYARGR